MKPKIVKKFHSKFNKSILLIEGHQGYSLLVDGVAQSGEDINQVWDRTFAQLIPGVSVNSVLILGFGAGSVVQALRRRYPEVKITGVEIDPIMLKIGRQYFDHNFRQVDVINRDALEYIAQPDPDQFFDLIIVDCYLGAVENLALKQLPTLISLKSIGQRVLYNQLFLPGLRSELSKIDFLKQLDQIFPVQALKLPYNIIIKY